MRRRREDASSLELLLAAMCNAFGGVMFIAVSLVVVISMVRSASRALEENAPRKLEQLQQELARQQVLIHFEDRWIPRERTAGEYSPASQSDPDRQKDSAR